MTSADAHANVLGALATAIADRSAEAVAAAAGQSLSAATALSALHHFLDRPTIDSLRRVLGLTPSGAVRLVDRLESDGLVSRGPGDDKRSRSVTLTDAGRAAAERVSAARARVLAEVLQVLPAADQAVLHDLLSRLMAGVVRTKDGGAWICRLCDLDGLRPGRGPLSRRQRGRRKVRLHSPRRPLTPTSRRSWTYLSELPDVERDKAKIGAVAGLRGSFGRAGGVRPRPRRRSPALSRIRSPGTPSRNHSARRSANTSISQRPAPAESSVRSRGSFGAAG